MADTSAIEIRGEWTIRDCIGFHYFHTFRRAWPLLPAAAAAAALAPALLLFGGSRPLVGRLIPFSGMSLMWLVCILLAPHWKAARQWKAQLYLRKSATVWFDAGGMGIKGADSSCSAAWKTIISVWETRRQFVFYYAPSLAYIVPKRFFQGADEIAAFRALVASAISPKVIVQPGLMGRWC
jgi:hypothetical protein